MSFVKTSAVKAIYQQFARDFDEIRYKKSAHNLVEYLSVFKKSAQGGSTYLTSFIETFLGIKF